MSSRIILLGGGSLASEYLSWRLVQDPTYCNNNNIYFTDDNPTNSALSQYNIPFLSSIADFYPDPSDTLYSLIASPISRRSTVSLLTSRGGKFASYIHPTALVSPTAKIHNGSILFPYSLASHNSEVGPFCVLNAHSTLGHDSTLGSFVTLSSHVDITGNCKIEDDVFFGSGSRIVPHKSVGTASIIGAGAVVMRNVKANQTVYTLPARTL